MNQLPPTQQISTLLPSLFQGAMSLPGSGSDLTSIPELDDHVRDALGAAIFSEYIRSAKSMAVTKLLPPPVAIAKRALESDYAQPWSVDALASLTETNANYLIHLFKKHVGESPMQYLWNHRMDAGVHLLQTTRLTIDEVSHRCGFQSAAHFSRRVKERKGVPPSTVRR